MIRDIPDVVFRGVLNAGVVIDLRGPQCSLLWRVPVPFSRSLCAAWICVNRFSRMFTH